MLFLWALEIILVCCLVRGKLLMSFTWHVRVWWEENRDSSLNSYKDPVLHPFGSARWAVFFWMPSGWNSLLGTRKQAGSYRAGHCQMDLSEAENWDIQADLVLMILSWKELENSPGRSDSSGETVSGWADFVLARRFGCCKVLWKRRLQRFFDCKILLSWQSWWQCH